jgi:hypothetical protein
MKQFFKPVGQCLTTAVVTSAMLESYAFPLLALPTAEFSPSQPAESSDSTVQPYAAPLAHSEAVSPPEVVSSPEVAPAILVVPAALTEIGSNSLTSGTVTSGTVTSGTVPTVEPAVQNAVPDAAAPAQTTPTQTVSPEAVEAIASVTALETARQALAEKLEALVEQDKPEREAEFRQNLVASALHYAEVGEFEQARQVAQHPVLPAEIQGEILAKIDELEVAKQLEQPLTDETVTIAQLPTAELSNPAGYSNIGARTLPPGLAYSGDRCLAPARGDRLNLEMASSLSGVKLTASLSTRDENQQLTSLLTFSNAAGETINLIQSKLEKSKPSQMGETIVLSESSGFSQTVEANVDASNAKGLSELGHSQQTAERWGEVKLNRVVGSTLDSLLSKVGITTIPSVFNAVFLGQTYSTVSDGEIQSSLDQELSLEASERLTVERIESEPIEPDVDVSLPSIPFAGEVDMTPLAIATAPSAPLQELSKGFSKGGDAIAPIQQTLNWQKSNSENPFALLAQSNSGSLNCAFAARGFAPGYAITTAIGQQLNRIGLAFPLPIPAALTSAFGWRVHPIFGDRRFHAGIDLGAPQGTPVIAAVSGRVAVADYMGGYGLTVVLENQDVALRNLYAHLSGIAVQPGIWVEQGSVIGWVGSTGNSTGPHLHFEAQQLTDNGWVAVDPLAGGALSVARAQ